MPSNPFGMADKLLDIISPDLCCAKRLSQALASGLQSDKWICPKCSVEWLAELKHGEDETPYRLWKPHTPVVVFRT